MNYDLIKSAIADVIKQNGNEEITGNILQQVLLSIINVLGLGYQYIGIATPETTPGTPDAKVFYIAQAAGTYSNFNDGASSPVLDGTAIGLFAFDTQWHNTILDVATKSSVVAIVTEIDEELNGKIDKVANATPGNLPQFGNDGALTDSNIPSSDVATKQELAVATLPGLAEAVIDTDSAGTEQEITFRKSGGDGGAYYRKIKGKTLAWNQMVNHINPIVSGDTAHLSCTREPDGRYKLVLTESVNALTDITFCNTINDFYIANHKYCININSDSNLSQYLGYNNQNGVWWQNTPSGFVATSKPAIWTRESNFTGMFKLYVGSNLPAGTYYFYPTCSDLTLLYGSEIDGLTNEQILAKYEADFGTGYHPFAQKLISNDAESIETVGFNQWDEEWEVGAYSTSTGEKSTSSTSFRSKNFVPIIKGASCYINFAKTNYANNSEICVLQYDANKSLIRYNYYAVGGIKTLDSECAFLSFFVSNAAIYNHDICINISNPAINGTYEPYWKRTLQLGITTKKDTDGNVPFADGMKGDGWTHADECDKNGGRILIRKVVFDGTEGWNFTAGSVFTLSLPVPALLTNNNGRGYGLSNKFGVNTPAIGFPTTNTWDVVDYRVGFNRTLVPALVESTNPQDWKDWLAAQYANGAPLEIVYAIATPVPFTWAEPLNLGVKVDENGTERAVGSEGATDPSAPFVADTTYTMSIARMVEILKNV